MKDELETIVTGACKKHFGLELDPQLVRPEPRFGDFATNIALRLAKQLGKPPAEIADVLSAAIANNEGVAKAEVAGQGFINITLQDDRLAAEVMAAVTNERYGANDALAGQTIVIEHTDPNPFKELHIGHVYSNSVGVALGKLLQNSAADVRQVSYHGDVGMHIAMAVWAIDKARHSQPDLLAKADALDLPKLSAWLGRYYATGAEAYRQDPADKVEIETVNKQLYEQSDSTLNELYEWGRAKSFAYFERIYRELSFTDEHQQLPVSFEKQYLESQAAPLGAELVRKYTGPVFSQSDGAIVFEGEKEGLHTRVFLNSQGLPTYEAKELGLAQLKKQDYPAASRFLVLTANEISEYFRVVKAALGRLDAELAGKLVHITHGVVRLPGGKMSSRTGEVVSYTTLADNLQARLMLTYNTLQKRHDIVLGALKYAFLKHRLGGDIIFELDESVSVEGNSGPYVQYAHARARSILAKAPAQPATVKDLTAEERRLAAKISEFPEVLLRAAEELAPHQVCGYLYELAQAFNRFYEGNQVIGDHRQASRLALVVAYANVLKRGLNVLNIPAPYAM